MPQSIAEIWARGVNEKTKSNDVKLQTAPVKPVIDKETESRKAQFRQNILNSNNKQKEEQPNG